MLELEQWRSQDFELGGAQPPKPFRSILGSNLHGVLQKFFRPTLLKDLTKN
jgi:hypothetical protein